MALPNDDQVRFDILIEAKQAIQNMRAILKTTEDNTTKIQLFSVLVMDSAKKWGIAWQQALGVYKQLNAELAKSKKGTLFGNVGGQDLFAGTDKYLNTLQTAGRLQDQVADSAKKMGNEVENAGKKSVRGIDVVRIALGALVAMLIFNVIAAIQNTFRMFIDNLRETELAIYNLINAERRLSEEGIDVTPKGLQETIDAVRALVPILSQIQAEELVSRVATNVAPSLKFTDEQIRQLSESVALLYIRNKALGKSFEEVESQVTNAFLTGKVSQGINQLGVKITDQIVRDEALRMGLVETEEEFDKLTGEMESQVKAAAMLSVVYKNVQGDVESLGEYMETTDAQIERSKTAWSDLLTLLGQFSGPTLAKGIGLIADALEGWIGILTFLKPVIADFIATVTAGFQMLAYLAQNPMTNPMEFADQFAKLKNAALEGLMSEFADAIDTPTAAVENLQDTLDDFDASKFEQEIEDILEDAARAREDLDKKLSQKKEDLDLEYLRKAEDAEKDYLRKIEDINRDAERDLQNLKDKHREEDIRAEQDYQNKLWELRMRYLMNLEDALHARDARQVIRLMKEYAIDKEALERKKNLEDKQREEDQKDEIAEIEQRRQERIEDARIEYEQKLADQRLAKQRELDDMNVWYERELADLEQSIQRKMEALIDGWIEEQKLTEANAAQVYGILYKYFGPGGMTDALYAYMRQQFSQPIPIPLPGGMPAPYWELAAGSTPPSTGVKDGREMSTSGAMLAARPTSSIFGTGSNINSPLPLNRIGRDSGKFSGSGGNNAGMDGLIRMELMLSPDLEARVVENTMNGVADIIVKVTDSK